MLSGHHAERAITADGRLIRMPKMGTSQKRGPHRRGGLTRPSCRRRERGGAVRVGGHIPPHLPGDADDPVGESEKAFPATGKADRNAERSLDLLSKREASRFPC